MDDETFAGAVEYLIGEGLGVEDIAHILICDTDEVRREVRIMRLNGKLKRIFRSKDAIPT